jgi:hypothetical protein
MALFGHQNEPGNCVLPTRRHSGLENSEKLSSASIQAGTAKLKRESSASKAGAGITFCDSWNKECLPQ